MKLECFTTLDVDACFNSQRNSRCSICALLVQYWEVSGRVFFFHLNRKIVQRRAAALCEDPMAGRLAAKVEFDISESVKGVIVGPFVTLTMPE
jgi:hypothetical protein